MKANARIVPEVPGEVFLKTVNDCIEKINSQSEGHLELNVIQIFQQLKVQKIMI